MTRVLILDDRPINRQVLTTLLAYKGFETREAVDGVEGLDIAREWTPDLAIVDIVMPNMDGIEFVRQLRADPQLAATPIIFYTASYDEAVALRIGREAGVAQVLMKPSEPELILKTIDETLGRTTARPLPGDRTASAFDRLQTAAMRTSALVDFQLEIAAQRGAVDILKILARAARNIIASEHSIVSVAGARLTGCEHPDCESAVGPRIRVPLETAAQRYGWLTLIGKEGREDYDADDERMALTIVAQAAIAYENLKLYDEIRMEADLLDRNVNLLHATIEASGDGIVVIDRSSRFVTFNQKFVEIMRVPEEILDSGDANRGLQFSLGELKDPVAFGAVVERVRDGGEARATLEMNDGRFIEFIGAPRRLDGEIIGRVWTFRDVTASVRAEEELRHVARERELLLESTGDGIFALDVHGVCTMANHVAASLLGREVEELVGRRIHDLVHSHGTDQCAMLAPIKIGEAKRVAEDLFRHRDGTTFPVEYRSSPIVDQSVLRGAVVTFADISERRLLEQRLEQIGRIDSLGRMAATIAHEFNNVLMGIQPFAEVIRRKAAGDESLQKAAGHIMNSVARGKGITHDILRIARPAEPQVRSVELTPWLEQIVAEIRALVGARVNVDLDVPPWDPLFVQFDPAQMQQVLTNLAVNARDAMGGNGTLRVIAERSGSQVRMIVADTGCGIDGKTLPYIFEPLFTTKHSGTGLGLAVAQQIVVRNGGIIAVESAVGEGTRFTIEFPEAQAPEHDSAGDDQSDPEQLGVHRVLIVEDDPEVASGLAAILEGAGLAVRAVERGSEAVRAAAAFEPDVVLIDISLPDMSGAEVYELIVARWPRMSVIFSTGHADEANMPQMRSAHVGFLRKPYSGDTLLSKLREVV
jgi:PAS domain S-box-containing protein